ncbi:MAG: ABC transporter substrate-binding protein [Bdellovibrionota bacterium]
MNRKASFLFSLLLLSFTAVGIQAHAATHPVATTPRGAVETIIAQAKELNNPAVRAQHVKTIESLVDFHVLAEEALGDLTHKATPAQRQEIRRLLKGIITKTVYPEAPKFFEDVSIAYTSERQAGQKVHITSVVTKGDRRSTVEYWLARSGDTYRVVDLAVEGERWVENVHDQFREVVQKQGVSGLIARMKKRLAQLEEPKKKKS